MTVLLTVLYLLVVKSKDGIEFINQLLAVLPSPRLSDCTVGCIRSWSHSVRYFTN